MLCVGGANNLGAPPDSTVNVSKHGGSGALERLEYGRASGGLAVAEGEGGVLVVVVVVV